MRNRGSLVARLHTMAVQSTFGLVDTTKHNTKQADMTVVLTIVFLCGENIVKRTVEAGCE